MTFIHEVRIEEAGRPMEGFLRFCPNGPSREWGWGKGSGNHESHYETDISEL